MGNGTFEGKIRGNETTESEIVEKEASEFDEKWNLEHWKMNCLEMDEKEIVEIETPEI